MKGFDLAAVYCQDIKELLLDDGRAIKVPDQVASTVNAESLDTRFVRSWAVMSGLITPSQNIGIVENV